MQEWSKIGVFGGTFDPVHIGHLIAAEAVLEAAALDTVLLIPSHAPPHRFTPNATPQQRLEMVSLAVRDHPQLHASDIEVALPGISYTIDTLSRLQTLHPRAKISFIMGLDAFLDIYTWSSFEDLLRRWQVIVMTRPGWHPSQLWQIGEHFSAVIPDLSYPPNPFPPLPLELPVAGASHAVKLVRIPRIDISASDIRQRMRDGKSIRYRVPATVREYILRERVYATNVAGL